MFSSLPKADMDRRPSAFAPSATAWGLAQQLAILLVDRFVALTGAFAQTFNIKNFNLATGERQRQSLATPRSWTNSAVWRHLEIDGR